MCTAPPGWRPSGTGARSWCRRRRPGWRPCAGVSETGTARLAPSPTWEAYGGRPGIIRARPRPWRTHLASTRTSATGAARPRPSTRPFAAEGLRRPAPGQDLSPAGPRPGPPDRQPRGSSPRAGRPGPVRHGRRRHRQSSRHVSAGTGDLPADRRGRGHRGVRRTSGAHRHAAGSAPIMTAGQTPGTRGESATCRSCSRHVIGVRSELSNRSGLVCVPKVRGHCGKLTMEAHDGYAACGMERGNEEGRAES